MRLIGGTLRGRTLNPPPGYEARPTTDFAREGLFNTLDSEFWFEDLVVLDLFGGTGSVSVGAVTVGGVAPPGRVCTVSWVRAASSRSR